MFTPHSLGIALIMMITSAICWGSWANTYKGVKNYRFELFYWDYAVGIFLISLVLAFTMGSTTNDANSFLNNVHSADASNIVSTMVGGAIFNLANLLLVAAIDMAGLAIAFPVAIGIALVVGVVLSYILQPIGNGALLAAGVVCAVIAVIMDGKAYGSLASAGRSTSKKSIVVCIVSGVLMGLWAPFVAHAMTKGNTLGPYSVAVFLTLGALLSCCIWNVYFMRKPLVGEPVSFQRILSRSRFRPPAWTARRRDLGYGDGIQSRGRELHGCSDFLRHRPVRANGGRAMGSGGMEGIRRRWESRQSVPRPYVCLLLCCDFTGGEGKRISNAALNWRHS
jgi:glucose uptake protein